MIHLCKLYNLVGLISTLTTDIYTPIVNKAVSNELCNFFQYLKFTI